MRSGSKTVRGSSIIFILKGIMTFQSQKVHAFCWNKNIIKTRRNWKWEMPPSVLEKWTMCFSLHKNCKLKVKLRWVVAREKRKSAFNVYLVQRKLLYICILSQCIVHWVNYHNIYIFTYQKLLPHIHFCCLFLKSLKALSISLNRWKNLNHFKSDLLKP